MLIQFFILRSWRGSFGARRASHCLFLYSRSRALKSPTQLRRWGVRLFLLQCKTALLVIVSIPVLLNWVWEKYGPMMMMMKKKQQRRKKLLPDYYFSRAIKWKPSFLGFCLLMLRDQTVIFYLLTGCCWTHWRLLYYRKLLMKQRWKLSPYNPLQGNYPNPVLLGQRWWCFSTAAAKAKSKQCSVRIFKTLPKSGLKVLV